MGVVLFQVHGDGDSKLPDNGIGSQRFAVGPVWRKLFQNPQYVDL